MLSNSFLFIFIFIRTRSSWSDTLHCRLTLLVLSCVGLPCFNSPLDVCAHYTPGTEYLLCWPTLTFSHLESTVPCVSILHPLQSYFSPGRIKEEPLIDIAQGCVTRPVNSRLVLSSERQGGVVGLASPCTPTRQISPNTWRNLHFRTLASLQLRLPIPRRRVLPR
ncbi:hypothetical protein LX36DRAFT_34827 [Colletotrichum falcatum]|nr:hypothetical protein LX36DRAFT_34827 [Colletotrichum falcatum]